jgi:hypothetical protein
MTVPGCFTAEIWVAVFHRGHGAALKPTNSSCVTKQCSARGEDGLKHALTKPKLCFNSVPQVRQS